MYYCWIDDNGNIIEVPKFGHNDYAYELLKEEIGRFKIMDYLEEKNCNHPYQILHKRGWVRVSELLTGKIRIYGDCISYVGIMRNTMSPAMNEKQLKTAKKICKRFNTEFLDAINDFRS